MQHTKCQSALKLINSPLLTLVFIWLQIEKSLEYESSGTFNYYCKCVSLI